MKNYHIGMRQNVLMHFMKEMCDYAYLFLCKHTKKIFIFENLAKNDLILNLKHNDY